MRRRLAGRAKTKEIFLTFGGVNNLKGSACLHATQPHVRMVFGFVLLVTRAKIIMAEELNLTSPSHKIACRFFTWVRHHW